MKGLEYANTFLLQRREIMRNNVSGAGEASAQLLDVTTAIQPPLPWA